MEPPLKKNPYYVKLIRAMVPVQFCNEPVKCKAEFWGIQEETKKDRDMEVKNIQVARYRAKFDPRVIARYVFTAVMNCRSGIRQVD